MEKFHSTLLLEMVIALNDLGRMDGPTLAIMQLKSLKF